MVQVAYYYCRLAHPLASSADLAANGELFCQWGLQISFVVVEPYRLARTSFFEEPRLAEEVWT